MDDRYQDIINLIQKYENPIRKFFPGETYISPSGTLVGDEEIANVIDAALDGLENNRWATHDKYNTLFSKKLREFTGSRHALLCNSGSSANLLAMSALCSEKLPNHLRRGDRVITAATGFPTTVNPIIQNGLIPVFVDSRLSTANIDTELLERTLEYDPKAVIVAHTLGNPFNVDAVLEFADHHKIWVIADCCDVLGAKWKGSPIEKYGAMSTMSFYPAHHISAGEGGCVFTDRPLLSKIVASLRDWGRACWCDPGCDNTCGMRFDQQFGNLPEGYDHKYVYDEIGYNLKMTNLQAAIGAAQMDKIENVLHVRRLNWTRIYAKLAKWDEFFMFQASEDNAQFSPFGFLITLKDNCPFTRRDIIKYLEDHKIGTRLLFGGNLTKQPAYLKYNTPMVGSMEVADKFMNDAFWIGCWPGITDEMINYILEVFHDFMRKNT